MNIRRPILTAFAVLSIASCAGDDAISIEGQWARTSPSMASMGAAYMSIRAAEGDRLVGVSVPASVAARAEIHEMVPVDSEHEMDHDMDHDGDHDMDHDEEMSMDMGAMVMQQVMALDLPAGTAVELEPGGYHIMLIDLAEPLVEGQTFEVTLDFAEAEDMTVQVEVRSEAP